MIEFVNFISKNSGTSYVRKDSMMFGTRKTIVFNKLRTIHCHKFSIINGACIYFYYEKIKNHENKR